MLTLVSDCLTATPSDRGRAAVLGGACLGENACSENDWPVQVVPAPLLGHPRSLHQEVWYCDGTCRDGEFAGIRYRRNEHLIYGVVVVDESDHVGGADCKPLRTATETAYRRIFGLLDQERLPHLWRVWNYLADINHEQQGLERYRQFNVGRHEAFLGCGRLAAGNVPAASALGLAGGPLRIAFMAGVQPALPIENPRQVSAYDYPADYGPCSPAFSRAALVGLPGREVLFISGTASIVGHRTVHLDDAAGQAQEALANVAAVLAEANRGCRSATFGMDDLAFRVYVRHAIDFSAVRDALQPSIGGAAEVLYVQADICRADLLVEIEGSAARDPGDS